jgi:hypothetical protein
VTFHAICVTEDTSLRRTLRRSLQGAGSTIEFAAVEGADVLGGADLFIVDTEARRRLDVRRLGERTGAQLLVVADTVTEAAVIDLMRAREVNHVVSTTDDAALLVTSGKLQRGDIFGIEKYLAWGALVRERTVKGYDEKRRALAELLEFAVEAGARRQLAARIETVADELLMNALYDAPALRHGVAPLAAANLDPDVPAVLRYGSDGKSIGVSVRDAYGELTKEAILDSLARAHDRRGPKDVPGGGAGLGLHMVIRSVVRFVANLDPGRATEVIGMFRLDATGREQDTCARSLHIFTTPSRP